MSPVGDNFVAKQEPIIECPPVAENRRFNENDIIGDCDRDGNGNLIVPTDKDKDGNLIDGQGKPISKKGYLIDPKTGDVINNLNGEVMFPKADLDEETGDLPAPFNWEKYNFDP